MLAGKESELTLNDQLMASRTGMNSVKWQDSLSFSSHKDAQDWEKRNSIERKREVSASCCCCWNVGQQAILKSVCEREKTLCTRESCRHRQSTKCNWRATGLIDRGRHSFRHDRSIENTFINKRCRELEMANGHENKQRTYQDLCVPIISTPRPNLINVRNNKHITRQQLWIKETKGGHKKSRRYYTHTHFDDRHGPSVSSSFTSHVQSVKNVTH